MAYFLKQTKLKNRTYLSIVESFYNPNKKGASHRIYKSLTSIESLKEAGIEAELSHFAFCTNGSHFCGEKGIPTIGYGPSLESLAHTRDEYIEIEQLTKACRGFECILDNLTK